MKDIVKWLRKIEHQANEVYMRAAALYVDDPKLWKFLEHSSEDEAWHYHVMGSAVDFLSSASELIPAISIDKETNDKIHTYLDDISDCLNKKTLSRDELIQKIVTLELSEWNDIFLYAVNVLKEVAPEFRYPAATIQAHMREITYFLESVEKRPELLKQITSLPPVWTENILIVDDNEMITTLFNSLLNREGNVDLANNGQEALEQIDKKYYKLIISDIDMPIVDGISFFKLATAKFPGLTNRFLFVSGDVSAERKDFFNENGLKYFLKPVPINILREEAMKIILQR